MSNTTIVINQSHRTQLRTDIEAFVSSYVPKQNLFFSNERDFQMHLACYLKDTKHYNQVYLEHNIPVSSFNNYPWKYEGMVYVDIAVKNKDGKWVPIELKYKTTNAPDTCPTEMERFGTMLQGCVKNQSARNLGCYAFWKDVRRIELIKKKNDYPQRGDEL